MSEAAFIDHLSSLVLLHRSVQKEISNVLIKEEYKPHQIIHAAGHTENRCWFVNLGLVRTYYFERSGKEHTLTFYTENSIVWSNLGYWKEPADHYIEVLEPTILHAINYRDLDRLSIEHPALAEITSLLIRQQYQRELQKSRLLDLPAEERYRQLRREIPGLFRRASVRLLATYLNMTRENLSRLMGRDL